MKLVLGVALFGIFLLTACGQGDAVPDDPIPNVRAGLIALYSGDLAGVDQYFCDEILLDAKDIANDNALGNGRIELIDTQFEVTARQSEQNWTVTMTGTYAIWRSGQRVEHNTEAEGLLLYFGMQVEDGIWKICAIAEERVNVPTPPQG